jgi:hypothetical protein
MTKYLELFAMAAGVPGVLAALIAMLGRVLGAHYILGVESVSVLIGAIALMAASCVVQLHLLRSR